MQEDPLLTREIYRIFIAFVIPVKIVENARKRLYYVDKKIRRIRRMKLEMEWRIFEAIFFQ